MRRTLAAVLSAAVALTSVPASAANVVRTGNIRAAGPVTPVVPSIGRNLPLSGAVLTGAPHLSPSMPSLSVSPSLIQGAVAVPAPLAPAAVLSAAQAGPAAPQAVSAARALPGAPAAPNDAPTPFERSLKALGLSSDIGALPEDAPAEGSGAAARTDFDKRLGLAGIEAEAAAFAEPSLRARGPLAAPTAHEARRGPAGMDYVPHRSQRENRSALFPLWLATLSGAAWLALEASRWSAGALSGEPTTAMAAVGIAAATTLVISGVFALNAIVEAATFGLMLWKGRKVDDREFRDFLRAEVLEGRLDANAAALIRPYRPNRGEWNGLTFAFAARGQIWVRPELIVFPRLLRMTLLHELSHLKRGAVRGPPRGMLRRVVRNFISEMRARVTELRGPGALKKIKVASLERALQQAQISLKLARPYEVLVLNPAEAQLRDPKLYAGLSDGTARVTPLDATDPSRALRESGERRYQAVVLGGAAGLLPEPSSTDGKRLDAALKQLDSLFLLSTRLVARGGAAFSDAESSKGWTELVGRAQRLREKGSAKALAAFESDVRGLWNQIATTKLKGLQAASVMENLYRSLADGGMGFVSFAPGEKGASAWERLLRYWDAPDGGQLRVTRVDLEDGGHVLVVRKVESRKGLWLRPINGGHFETSVANADHSEEGRAKARAALTAAGFGDQLAKFDELGVSVRHVFGADLGRQEIFITVPKANAPAIRKFVSSESTIIESSRQDYVPHLMDSANIQNVRPVWQAGFTGAAGTILWVDTGGDATHEDFLGRMEVVDMVNEGPEDWHGHGTHVAGISIADRDPFIGMAPKANGIMVKVFSRESPGGSDGDIMGSAVIARERGVDVISLSLGKRGSSADRLSDFFSELTKQKMSNGEYPIVTASAGNSGPFDKTISEPAAGAETIAVAAAAKSLDDKRPEISFFSSVGPDTDRRYSIRRLRLKPDLTALGGDVTTRLGQAAIYLAGIFSSKSKDSPASPNDYADGKHTGLAGTSMANPMVAGIARLVKQAMKSTGAMTPFVAENLPFVMKAVLMRTSRDLGAPVWFQGSGLVDAWEAVKLVAAAAGAPLKRGLRRLLAQETTGPPEGWAWVERLKALRDLEDEVFKTAEMAKSEAQARLEESDSDAEDADVPAEERAAINNAAQGEAQRKFNAARDAALPKALEALKDPFWLVRHQAAFILMNFRAPAAALALGDAALNDADARVRRLAFLALAETPGHSVDVLLAKAAGRKDWDGAAYAAYALARRGDRAGVSRIVQEMGSADKAARFTGAWLLGQLQTAATAPEAEALSARVKDPQERGNIRHLAAASLGNIASAAPEAVSDRVIMDMLEAAGPDELALTRTIQKFFPIALRDRTLVARLRQEPLKSIVVGFVTRNKDAVLKPGALSELVQQLARVVNVPLDSPTALADPSGTGVAGVDPAAGPLDLIVLPPAGGADLEAEFLARFEATVRAPLARSGLLWVSVPEHKLYAFTLALQHRGFGVRESLALYPLVKGAPGKGTVVDLGDGESPVSLAPGADLSLIKLRSSAGISEARVMAALEALAEMTDGKGPVVLSLGLTAPRGRKLALTVLVDRLVASGMGVVVPAGDAGPRAGTVTGPGDSTLAVTVAAASGKREPAFYSGRGTAEVPSLTWTDLVDELLPGAPLADGAAVGTGVAAERTAEKLAALARTLAEGLALKGRQVPAGWFQLLTATVERVLLPMAGSRKHEVGGGLFADLGPAVEALERRLQDPDGIEREAAAHLARIRGAQEAPAAAPAASAAAALVSGVAGFRAADGLTRAAIESFDASANLQAGAKTRREWLKDYKRALMDGLDAADGTRVGAFRFKTSGDWVAARSAGLEGFLYTKRELARAGVSTLGQLEDQFRYVDALLSGSGVLAAWRRRFAELALAPAPPEAKLTAFDALLEQAVADLRGRVTAFDPSHWGRRNATYMVFARAYNRLKPGKSFFDSFDEAELLRVKRDPAIRANELWLMDVFEIGEVNRWGTGGGSSYSIKGYVIKKELGGEEGFKALVARAHKAGLKVKLDFIPNHTSLDSEMIAQRPEGLLHVVPPQDLSDEQIMAAVPREPNGNRAPIYRLVKTDNYPLGGGRRGPMRILVHHPRTDYGDVMWVDLAQIDYSRPEAREWQTQQMRRLFETLGVDSARRDMAYEILNARYPSRWLHILKDELKDIPEGWMRIRHEEMIKGFEARWQALQGAEFFEQATDEVKQHAENAVMIDEAYSHADELSRSGSDGVYNKNDHDLSRRQAGLYDAMQSRDPGKIREALRHAAFRRWQRGGAPMVNFVGTHDGGEGNPVDKFGRLFKSAVLTAMLMRPILYYNGLEQGVGQQANLIADLSKSVDTAKAIPYDIPVQINWANVDQANRDHLSKVLAVGERSQNTFDSGVMEVLEPNWNTPIVAWSQSDGLGEHFVMAANWSEGRSGAQFRFDKPVMGGLGAFVPEAGRRYRFTDQLDASISFERDGKELLEKGLYIELPGGGTHLFKVEAL